jgi:tetratricopeptide (TPR) repeat protein
MDLSQRAIQLALEGKWKEAITENLTILKQNPKDIDALNRLGRAYQEIGLKTNAANCYQKVLKIDKFNAIASRNLSLSKTAKAHRSGSNTPRPNPTLTMFLEEPGVTKTVLLTRLGDPKSISSLHPGDPVQVISRQHTVCVITNNGIYVGRLPDDISSRLRTLLAAGNKYSAWIRTIDSKSIKVFIRETFRSPKYQHTPSFPLTEKLTYAAFTPPELVHEEKPDVSATEDQEDSTPQNEDLDSES